MATMAVYTNQRAAAARRLTNDPSALGWDWAGHCLHASWAKAATSLGPHLVHYERVARETTSVASRMVGIWSHMSMLFCPGVCAEWDSTRRRP